MRYTIYDGEGTQAVILPEKGATVVSLKRNGEEFLYCDPSNLESDERPRCGIPFLFPTFGRLENGSYTYNGKSYDMGIHGFAHTSAWQVVSHTENALRLALEADQKTLAIFPFRFRVELSYTVDEGVLAIHQCFQNIGCETMPYSFGLHPYFRVASPNYGWVRINAGYCTNCNTGKKTVFGRGCISSMVQPGDGELSFIFENVQSPAILSIPAEGRRVTLRFDDSFPWLAVWKLPDSPFLCVEPINGLPNGLNTGEHFLLQPGQTRTAVVWICPECSGW